MIFFGIFVDVVSILIERIVVNVRVVFYNESMVDIAAFADPCCKYGDAVPVLGIEHSLQIIVIPSVFQDFYDILDSQRIDDNLSAKNLEIVILVTIFV